jgi:hypothetical protein
MLALLLYSFYVLDIITKITINKVFKVSTIIVLHIYKLNKKEFDNKNISVISCTYPRCVNTVWFVNLELNSTIHIHMFPISHKLSKSVNNSQRSNKANLTDICGYLDLITVSRIYNPH